MSARTRVYTHTRTASLYDHPSSYRHGNTSICGPMCIPYVTKQTFDPTPPSATRTSRPPLSIIGRRMTKLHTTTPTAAPLACTRWLIQLVHNFLQIHTETHLCQYEPIRTKCRYRMLRNRVSPVACSREREREREELCGIPRGSTIRWYVLHAFS